MFNKTILEEGYAQIATFSRNIKYVDDFKELEKTAREMKFGLILYN
jgi:micrococcal nuclease